MAEETKSPQYQVAEACMSLSDAIIQRKTLMTVEDAKKVGHDLFDWFDGEGALTDIKAPFAVRATASGTTLIVDKRPMTVEDVIDTIKKDYEVYADGA